MLSSGVRNDTAIYGGLPFSPQPTEPQNNVSPADADAIAFDQLATCVELVDAQLTLLQLTLNEIDSTPFREAMTGGNSSSLSSDVGYRFEQAFDRSECSGREFAFEFIERAETLTAEGALANLSKASFIEEQWDEISEGSEFSIAISVTAEKQTVAPGEMARLLVTVENDGTGSLHNVVLRETDSFGSSDATTVELPPLTTGPLEPDEKEHFTVSFEVPDEATEVITVEYDSAKGVGDGGSAFTSSGTGVSLLVRD